MKLLLHVCCGPCSTHVIKELMNEHSVVLFWSNPNIFPKDEYSRRLKQAKKMAEVHGLSLIEDDYDHQSWLEAVSGFEDEPEGGLRCAKCFEFNLNRTAEYAVTHDLEGFTTTLTISPHKDSTKISEIGEMLAEERGVIFLAQNFKKKDGFRHSIELSKKHGLYRQDYCGCEFSRSIASPKE